MDSQWLMRIEAKLDKVDERVDRVDVTLSAQHVSLTEHMRRTEILEEKVEPLVLHGAKRIGAWDLIKTALAGVGFFAAVVEILGYFNK
jgi:hypothetical protein